MLDQKYISSWLQMTRMSQDELVEVHLSDPKTEETMTGLSFPSSNYIHPIVVEIRYRPIIGPGSLLGRY